MYLLKRVEVWSPNRLSRVIKTPKLQFIDSGLLAALVGLTPALIGQERSRFGHLLATFVYAELLKHGSTAEADYKLLYYRDQDQMEVDIVIENTLGDLVGVEVKASATVTERDLRGLKRLATMAGKHFQMGVILYDGAQSVPLGDRLWAAPISTLWG